MKEPGGSVEPGAGDRSLRLSIAHLKASMLSSPPSTATITHPKLPDMITIMGLTQLMMDAREIQSDLILLIVFV